MRKHGSAVLLFAALGVLMVMPLPIRLRSSVAGDLGDPLFMAWRIDWNVRKMHEGFRGYWAANMFHPSPEAGVFADHYFGIALLAWPFWALTRHLVASQGIVVILTFVL